MSSWVKKSKSLKSIGSNLQIFSNVSENREKGNILQRYNEKDRKGPRWKNKTRRRSLQKILWTTSSSSYCYLFKFLPHGHMNSPWASSPKWKYLLKEILISFFFCKITNYNGEHEGSTTHQTINLITFLEWFPLVVQPSSSEQQRQLSAL